MSNNRLTKEDVVLFKVVGFEIGKYDFDTVIIESDTIAVQIPAKKGLYDSEIIGEEIEVNFNLIDNVRVFNRPIE